MSLPPAMFWIVHALASIGVAGLALAIGHWLHARLRLSHANDRYWRVVWLLAALPPLLAAVLQWWRPHSAAALPDALPLPVALDPGDAQQVIGTMLPAAFDSPLPASALLASLYALGAGIALLRHLRGSRVVATIVRAAAPVDRGRWPGARSATEAARLTAAGIGLRITARAMTPFAVRWPRATIVLPAGMLEQLDDDQLHLIVRHEAAHLHHRDPQRAALMTLAGILLWFNPLLRRIGTRVQLATELRCDAWALAVDDATGRSLATAYLHTLRAYAAMPAAASALNHRDLAGHALRIQHMLHGDGGRTLPRMAGIGLLAGTLPVLAALSLLQLALAAPSPPTAADAASTSTTAAVATAPSAVFGLDAPLRTLRITGRFGDTGGVRARPHHGTDFGARVGTPVLAPAAGIVTSATTRYPDGPDYGTVVVLDHGDGWQTLYAHLDGIDVDVGQRVAAGEQIARVGRSGRVTGPHLHLEALHHGQRVDPERLLQ